MHEPIVHALQAVKSSCGGASSSSNSSRPAAVVVLGGWGGGCESKKTPKKTLFLSKNDVFDFMKRAA
jgi:hypothetical protein